MDRRNEKCRPAPCLVTYPCHPACAGAHLWTDTETFTINDMTGNDQTRRIHATLACAVAAGVVLVTVLDHLQGQPPAGVIDLPSSVGLTLTVLGCIAAAAIVIRLMMFDAAQHREPLRRALVFVSLIPAVFGDPSYGSLMLAIPLIDIRREDDQPARTYWTLGILAAVAALVLTERTSAQANAFEHQIALAIVFLTVVLLGDALRSLDDSLHTERELAQLSERSRLAEELHDSLGHHLLACSVQLEKARALHSADPASSEQAIQHAARAVALAIGETRLIVDATRGDEHFEVEPSIRDLAHRIMPSGTMLDIQISGDHEEIQPSTRVTIYRIVQEALTNLVRHSAATVASITSTASDEAITISITDNGAGFDPATSDRGGVGNMRRRVEELGGEFAIDSSATGTAVTATVPR